MFVLLVKSKLVWKDILTVRTAVTVDIEIYNNYFALGFNVLNYIFVGTMNMRLDRVSTGWISTTCWSFRSLCIVLYTLTTRIIIAFGADDFRNTNIIVYVKNPLSLRGIIPQLNPYAK
jgi:hypothetical protein